MQNALALFEVVAWIPDGRAALLLVQKADYKPNHFAGWGLGKSVLNRVRAAITKGGHFVRMGNSQGHERPGPWKAWCCQVGTSASENVVLYSCTEQVTYVLGESLDHTWHGQSAIESASSASFLTLVYR